MSMILMVHGYRGAHNDVKRHLPYWEKTGQFHRIVYVGTEGERWMPPGAMEYVEIGEDGYIETPRLCDRLIRTIGWMIARRDWDFGCIIEYDTVLFQPFPPLPLGLSAHLAGGQLPRCKGHSFLHNPWVADRSTWEQIFVAGSRMLKDGDTENNSPDCFIAWICEKNGINVNHGAFKSYSRNTLHFARPPRQGDFSVEARQAVRDGAVSVHGCKDSRTYDVSGDKMLKFITS